MSKVSCAECGLSFSKIPLAHLLSHNIKSYEEYKAKYNNAPVSESEIQLDYEDEYRALNKFLGDDTKNVIANMDNYKREKYYYSEQEVELAKRITVLYNQKLAEGFFRTNHIANKMRETILHVMSNGVGLDGKKVSTRDLSSLYRVLIEDMKLAVNWMSEQNRSMSTDSYQQNYIELKANANKEILGDHEAFSNEHNYAPRIAVEERESVRGIMEDLSALVGDMEKSIGIDKKKKK